jgi:hypothetical protein
MRLDRFDEYIKRIDQRFDDLLRTLETATASLSASPALATAPASSPADRATAHVSPLAPVPRVAPGSATDNGLSKPRLRQVFLQILRQCVTDDVGSPCLLARLRFAAVGQPIEAFPDIPCEVHLDARVSGSDALAGSSWAWARWTFRLAFGRRHLLHSVFSMHQ